ncbi:hypothetical protein L596_025070 [Steinernema carpocapsae]|uniref:SAGA-associated factor 11 n=1 Tax=Steinernema carpocapsae TaxID=34508 RepID=A0A4U5M6Q6_STECR|nr:hypothetical protein L596_025070 [Steinernema carpocapsae]
MLLNLLDFKDFSRVLCIHCVVIGPSTSPFQCGMSSHKREQLRALRVKRREEITVDQAADLLYEDIVAAFVTQVTFVHHRANTLGLDLEANLPHENGINGNGVQQPGPSNGRVGTSNGFRSKYECPCPECGRVIAATRFAPHLENCLGMGRNASRAARRKAAGFYAAGNRLGRSSLSGRSFDFKLRTDRLPQLEAAQMNQTVRICLAA